MPWPIWTDDEVDAWHEHVGGVNFSGILSDTAVKPLLAVKRTCNKHNDCDTADADTLVGRAFHCHAEDCEECFGS